LWQIERIPARESGGVGERNGREERLFGCVFVKIKYKYGESRSRDNKRELVLKNKLILN
jgi:hypothetical protein